MTCSTGARVRCSTTFNTSVEDLNVVGVPGRFLMPTGPMNSHACRSLPRLTMLLRLCSTVSPRICSCSQRVISSNKSDRFLGLFHRTCDEGSAEQILFRCFYISSGYHFGPFLFLSFPSFTCFVWYQVAPSEQYIAFISLCPGSLSDTQRIPFEHYSTDSHHYIPLYFPNSKR